MSEAPNMFDWPQDQPLDVKAFMRHLEALFDSEFRKQADYAGLRSIRYDPNSKLRERIMQLVQEFDGMRTETIRILRKQVVDLVNVTPRAGIVMKLEDAAQTFVQKERERCAQIADAAATASDVSGCYDHDAVMASK